MVENAECARIERNFLVVKEKAARAAERAGREPAGVRIMAVTKTVPRAVIEAAMKAGIGLFGENRVQEAQEKYTGLPGAFELHLIGHLQRNKARAASGLFSSVQSIDKRETAEALSAQCVSRNRSMDILLEVNTSGEATKSGFHSKEQLLASLDGILALPFLRVRGLMTVGPLDPELEVTRRAFSKLASLFRELAETRAIPALDTLSMGMSGDFEIAIEEGSTLVRIGTAIFGPRT